MSRFDPLIGTRRDELGTIVADIVAAQAGQTQEMAQITATTVEAPVIDGTFAPIYTAAKKQRMFVTLRFANFGTAKDIKVVLLPRAQVLSSSDYNNLRITAHLTEEFTDAITGLQLITSPLTVALDPLTQYDVIRLIGIDGSDRASNPTDDPLYAAYPGNVLYTFTTPAQASDAGAPSKPTSARLVSNTVDPNSDGSLSIATLRLYADETQVKTFTAQNTVSIQPKVIDSGGGKAPAPPISIEDGTLTFIDDSIGGLITGSAYTWTKNTAFDADGQGTVSAAGTLLFIAGGFADPSDSLANLTLVSVAFVTTEDANVLLVTFTLHQPNPSYKLKNYTAKRKVSTNPDSDYDLPRNLVVDRGDLHDPTYSTPGNIEITFPMGVHTSRTYKVKLIVRSIGGFVKEFISGDIAASAPTVAAQLSAQGGGPSLIVGSSLQASVKADNDLNTPPGLAGDAIYPMRQWDTFTNSGTRIDNKAAGAGGTFDTSGVRWDSANARLECATNIVTLGGKPAVRIGKLLHANDAVVLCPSFLSNSADITVDISFALVDQATGDVVVEPALAFPIPHTAEKRGLWILVVPPGYVNSGKQWIELRFGANPAQKVYTWNWLLDYGEVYRDYKINGDEKAVLDFLDVAPTNAALPATGIITESSNGDLFSRYGTKAGPISLS